MRYWPRGIAIPVDGDPRHIALPFEPTFALVLSWIGDEVDAALDWEWPAR